jgi:hypothetical protein
MSEDHAEIHGAAISIQASMRGRAARNDHAEKHGAAITIQAIHRGSVHRSKCMPANEGASDEGSSDEVQPAEQPTEQRAAPQKRDSTYVKPSAADVVEKRGSFQKGSMRKSVFMGRVRKEGILEKKGTGAAKKWHERYFTCQGHYLRYKDSKTAQQSGPDESWTKGTIDLNTITQIDVKIEGEKKPLLKIQAGGRLIKLRAASKEEVESWADACMAGMDDPLVREITGTRTFDATVH